MSENSLQAFVQAELARLSQQRQQAMTAKGMLPFLATVVGETVVRLHPKIPGDYDGGGGNIKKLFTVTTPKAPATDSNGTIDKEWSTLKEYAWPVNPKSPLYREVLEQLSKAPVNLAIVRTGKDKTDTRYSIRVLPN
ncbi:MAG TPA: hypothetical protein VEP90_18445 [Methylomirabilota bacterium]|nr:hypothetical protein [Methylomirabilota bacterium]